MFPHQYKNYMGYVAEYRHAMPKMDKGEAYWRVLFAYYPGIAARIAGTQFDPRNSVEDFLSHIKGE